MSDHKVVAKNTIFLYVRALLSMAIGLYASRVVLSQLGITDFGIYSVVGSLSMLFAYLNYGMSSSLMRFMAIDIAGSDHRVLQGCFSSCLQAALYVSAVVVVVCETVGLWALYHLLDLPPGSHGAAFFVFQASIVIMVLEIFRNCFQSLIIAYEKMSFFAYVAVAESLLKLGAVLLLMWIPGSKLRVYMVLLMGVSVLILLSYMVFCRYKFPHVRFIFAGGSRRLKEIFSFTGWNTLASFADLAYIQGSNILLNMFYGVAYNATMGITNQVKNAVYSFSKNLQTAANPHLTKEFASRQFESYSRLTMLVSVASFLLLYLIGLPVMLNTDFILSIWLKEVPPDAVTFIRLVIIFCLVDSLVGPLWVGMQAFGKIRTYQIIMSAGWLLSLPVIWLSLKFGARPQSILVVQIVFNTILLAIRLAFAVKYCHIQIGDYLKNVVGRIILAAVVSGLIPLMTIFIIANHIVAFFASLSACIVCIPLATLFIALQEQDRCKIIAIIKSKFAYGYK